MLIYSSIITQADYTSKMPIFNFSAFQSVGSVKGPYLGPQSERDKGKKTLVLDLDETLVHSAFDPVYNAEIVLQIEIESIRSNVYVLVRPGAYTLLE